ncbi:MAG: GNAT family N-acetyltransferase [Armatimonadetes bacterium]|nr:GNAT family N-acetyltransferase [Anaerolineae bacterium]
MIWHTVWRRCAGLLRQIPLDKPPYNPVRLPVLSTPRRDRMVSLSLPQDVNTSGNGMRPINLSTDLAALADLIELVFADTMDNNGRAALREMRMLSRVGVGLNMLSRLNEMALGINMGYVWFEDHKLVGNVSIYNTHWHADLGSAWIIANVGVHPDYQRRGIARRLMQASLNAIQQHGGGAVILQMDADNDPARALYLSLGFRAERVWTVWRRPAAARLPMQLATSDVHIVNRRNSEWRAEFALAQQVRPAVQGGVGWMRPLHANLFRPSLLKWLNNLSNLRSIERLVIRAKHAQALHAALWIERNGFASTRLTLMVDPEYAGLYDEALLSTAVRRYGGNTLMIEHPNDELTVNATLERYRFIRQRTIVHMRAELR